MKSLARLLCVLTLFSSLVSAAQRETPVHGGASARSLAPPAARIIILTNYDDPDYRDAAKAAGTSAYVLKEHLLDLIPIISPHSKRGSL